MPCKRKFELKPYGDHGYTELTKPPNTIQSHKITPNLVVFASRQQSGVGLRLIDTITLKLGLQVWSKPMCELAKDVSVTADTRVD
jgi:hypothetical protein